MQASTPLAMSEPPPSMVVGYQAGSSLASSITFSYLAVKSADRPVIPARLDVAGKEIHARDWRGGDRSAGPFRPVENSAPIPTAAGSKSELL